MTTGAEFDNNPPPPPLSPLGEPTQDDRTMALLAHMGGIVAGFVAPLVIWLIKKDQSRFVDDQAKEALNFQLTVMIVHFVAFIPSTFLCLAPTAGILLLTLLFCVIAGVESNKGVLYRYPINIRMIT